MKELSLVATGSAVKTGWVFILFAVAARFLNADQFADFSYWLTIAFIFNLFFDFGQQTGLLTKLASKPELIGAYVRRSFGLKYSIVAGALMLGLLTWLFGWIDSADFILLNFSLLGALAGSIGIGYCIVHRSARRYWPDLTLGILELAVAALGCMLIVYFRLFSERAFLTVFAVARMVGCITILMLTPRFIRLLWKPKWPERPVLLSWWPFFSHMAAGTLVVNLDLVITKFVLSPLEYSLYQGGMRIVQAANVAFTAVNNVFIPRWVVSDRVLGRAATNREFLRNALLGIIMAVPIVVLCVFFGEKISTSLFGVAFAPLGRYLPLFGLLACVRFIGALVGVLLSCRNKQVTRAIASTAGLGVLVVLLIPWSGSYQMDYVVSAQFLAHLVLLVILLFGLSRVWYVRSS